MSTNINADAFSALQTDIGLSASIASNTTTVGSVIDFETNCSSQVVGIDFSLTAFTDGSYLPLIEESEDGLAFTPVADINLRIKDVNGLYVDSGQEVLATLTALGKKELGYVLNKRYLRVSIISSSVTTGATAIVVIKYQRRLQK